MLPEEQACLFNRFAQANRRTTSEYGGSGTLNFIPFGEASFQDWDLSSVKNW